jgi:imidazolonepropionase-like amidohydrolase
MRRPRLHAGAAPALPAVLTLIAAMPAQDEHSGGSVPQAYFAGRLMTAEGPPITSGVLVVRDGRIAAIGPAATTAVPADAVREDFGDAVVCPGFVDLHHHVSGGPGGDINDMVMPINPELRTLDVVRPNEDAIRRTAAAGVTTTLFIPGSGTNISGFGVLLKMRWGEPLERLVIRELGAMKVAQGFNPERRSGDLGTTRMGSHDLLTRRLLDGKAYADAWRRFENGGGPRPDLRPELEQLRLVFERRVPVLIHTAGARDCVATARMFQDVFGLWMILSHGCFDGWTAAAALSKRKTPVNLGPRMYEFDRYGAFQGMCRAYWEVGCRDISINTDAPVVAAEELPLQAAMAVRLGFDYEQALRALTIVPAQQIGIADRTGSLAAGKDADFLVVRGDPLDPRCTPERVYIDGHLIHQNGDVK